MAVDLPFASEFSPTTVNLGDVLELAMAHKGNLPALQAALQAKYFDATDATETNKKTRAYNLQLGMRKYLLLDAEGNLTPTGVALYEVRTNNRKLHKAFAKHILANLHGMLMVQCVQDMQERGEEFSLTRLRKRLRDWQVLFPRAGTHASKMKLWLEKAGVFDGWQVDKAQLENVLGVSTSDIDVITSLTQEQQAYLLTLAGIGTPGPHLSNEVADLVTMTRGIELDEKNLPIQVLYPLRDANFIHLERGTAAGGQGAKPFKITAKPLLQNEITIPLVAQLGAQVDAAIRPLLREPLANIRAKLTSENRNTKGLALEALAFNLMRLLDLKFLAYRKRGVATAGAEVDLMFESTRMQYTRWQVQCKNTATVNLEDIAKEVGLTHILKSNVIVIVSTGNMSKDARQHAAQVMKKTNLCIVLMDKRDLDRIEKNPASIVGIFEREANHAMAVKAFA